jgi:hypothetical protein
MKHRPRDTRVPSVALTHCRRQDHVATELGFWRTDEAGTPSPVEFVGTHLPQRPNDPDAQLMLDH